MKKDPDVFLGHILDSIELIESYSRGKTEIDLIESVGLQDQINQKDRDNRGSCEKSAS